jgi:putative ABC transport system ATP-binding protein
MIFKNIFLMAVGLGLTLPVCVSAVEEQTFNSPDDAVNALVAAATNQDTNTLHLIFGAAGHEVMSPDVVQATEEYKLFVQHLTEKTELATNSDFKITLQIGADGWPFPIPLVKQDGQWFFDTAAGKEEILARRIGMDEIGAINVCNAYVDAQREYASEDRMGDSVLAYAKFLRSTPGTHDGLFWPVNQPDEVLSPLGPLIAQARVDGYHRTAKMLNDEQAPYHGYYFKIEAIVATDLTKWFGEGETKVTAVNGVGLVAHFGEMLFIVGPSGSGKTTMLSMISGILRPNAGNVKVKGADIWTLNNDELADFRLNTIGFVFQDYHLFPRLTTAENVAIPLILKQRNWNESITEATKDLEIVGLKGRGEILPVKLSGGEQQRVAIARAIISRPEILISTNRPPLLDGDTGRMIIAFVKEKILNEKRCILIVTHDARINEYADRILHMEDGRLTAIDKGTE